MGICCSNRPTRDDLMDEIRRDARISEYETKDNNNDDLFKSLTSPQTKEKIIFEVRDNPLEDYSKVVFQKLNDIRTNPILFYGESKKEGTSNIIEKLVGTETKPSLFSWSTKKSRIISDFFQNSKNSFKTTHQKIKEIKEKYENDYIIYTFEAKGNVAEPNRCIWNLIKKYSEPERDLFLCESFAYCVIYSEPGSDFAGSIVGNNNEVISFFFFFKLIDY